jgi:type II secretory pathway pseudopilin PulG
MRLIHILNKLTHRQSGSSLMETVVALGILAAISVTFLSGLTTTTRAAFISDRHVTAESLAQSQMEWAKDTAYVYEATGYSPAPLPGSKDYQDYSATISAQPLHAPDDGIQKITVAIQHSGQGVLRLEGYKVDR